MGLSGLGCSGDGFSQGPLVSFLPSDLRTKEPFGALHFSPPAGEVSATIPLVGIPKAGYLACVYSSANALPHCTDRPLPPSSPSNSIDGLLTLSPPTHPIAPMGS